MSITLHYYYVTLKTATVDHCWAFETQRRVWSCSFFSSCSCSFPRAAHHTWHELMRLKLCTHGGEGTELHQCQYWQAGCKDDKKIRAATEAQSEINRLGFGLCVLSSEALWLHRYNGPASQNEHLKTAECRAYTDGFKNHNSEKERRRKKKRTPEHQSGSETGSWTGSFALIWMLISVKCRLWKMSQHYWSKKRMSRLLMTNAAF